MVTTLSTPSLAARLRPAITRTARRMRQEGGGLTPTLAAALATVEHHGPLTPSELAGRERIKRPTATRLVARLQDDGLVARAADPADGRSCLISVTPAGTALLREVRSRKDAYLVRRLRALDPEDRAALAHAVEVLERLLDEDAA
jgi:DNA-binding MarR family transcriptional regulator